MENEIVKSNDEKFINLYKNISSILKTARENAYKAVNFAMVTSYWSIGQLIVEDEQKGEARAEYGKAVLGKLSLKLTEEFGKGFDELALPKPEELEHQIKMDRLLIEEQMKNNDEDEN